MIDLSASGVQQLVTVELLTRSREALDQLDGVRALIRERNQYASPSSGATLDLDVRDRTLDLTGKSIRAWVTLRQAGQPDETHPLFTGIPRLADSRRTRGGNLQLSLQLLDYTRLLDVPCGRPYAVPAGTQVTGMLREILTGAGATQPAITESDATTSTDWYFDGIETWRQIANDLAASIGYRAAWADAYGTIHCGPYARPQDRPPLDDDGLVHGRTCTYRPKLTTEDDSADAPNVATISARTAGDLPPAIGTARLPADHPLSAETQQLVVPYTETDVDLSVQALPEDPESVDIAEYLARLTEAANDYAARKLWERASPTRRHTVEVRWRPYELMDRHRLTAPALLGADPIDTTVVLVKDTVSYSAGGTLATTLTLEEVR